jgi:zinc-binding in reverse transcriptase
MILLFGYGNSMIITIKSLYIFLCFGGVTIRLHKSIWSLKILLKYKLFLWMTLNNRIFNKRSSMKKSWEGASTCIFCICQESVDHLFFHCPLIFEFWFKILTSHPQNEVFSYKFFIRVLRLLFIII